jgi:AraC-like DNA-binding protein
MIQVELNHTAYKLDHLTTNFMAKRSGQFNVMHRHPVFHLIFITEGRGVFTIDDCATVPEPGLLYIISPNEWHQLCGDEERPLSDYECTFLFIDEKGMPALTHFYDIVEQNRNLQLPASFKQQPFEVPVHLQPLLLEGFQRILESQNSFFTKEHLGVMVLDLLLRVEEIILRIHGHDMDPANKPEDLTITTLKQFLRTHMGRTIQLNELATLVHLTPNHLCKTFKAHTGETPMSYLHQIRMLEAKKLLAHTDLPVYLIAEKTGFEEASYFSKVFRKKYALSPKEYRQRLYDSSMSSTIIST